MGMDLNESESQSMMDSLIICVYCTTSIEQGQVGRLRCGCYYHIDKCGDTRKQVGHSCSLQLKQQIVEDYLINKSAYASAFATYWKIFEKQFPKLFAVLCDKNKPGLRFNRNEWHYLKRILKVCELCERKVDYGINRDEVPISFWRCCGVLLHSVQNDGCPAIRVRSAEQHVCEKVEYNLVVESFAKQRMCCENVEEAFIDHMEQSCVTLLSTLPGRLTIGELVLLRELASQNVQINKEKEQLRKELEQSKKESDLVTTKFVKLTRDVNQLKEQWTITQGETDKTDCKQENQKPQVDEDDDYIDDGSILDSAWDRFKSLFNKAQSSVSDLLQKNAGKQNRDKVRENNGKIEELMSISDDARNCVLDCMKTATSLVENGMERILDCEEPAAAPLSKADFEQFVRQFPFITITSNGL